MHNLSLAMGLHNGLGRTIFNATVYLPRRHKFFLVRALSSLDSIAAVDAQLLVGASQLLFPSLGS